MRQIFSRRTFSAGRFTIQCAIALVGVAIIAAQNTTAQVTYSVDAQGPTIGLASGGVGAPITEGDVLMPTPPTGPLPPPTVLIPGGVGAGTLGISPTIGGFSELDALSYGGDSVVQQTGTYYYYFSVDEFAVGQPGPPPVPPNVTTEGAFGALEASADVYVYAPPGPIPPAPPLPPGPVFGNTGVYDGNGGISPFASPTLNLWEPNPPTFFTTPDLGDNLDAVDIDTPPIVPAAFYSMDSAFVDPYEGPPYNTGTASANGFFGGDVIMTTAGGGPTLYAPAITLGLDLFGPDTDDLDALILNDTTDGSPGVFTPTIGPYSWLGGTDMLLFSVRRGSALIGVADGIFGAPIEPGDILVPMGPGTVPGIWIPAEALGLATVRSGVALIEGPLPVGDDLDALDVTQQLVPEPSACALAGIAAAAAFLRRRQSRAAV